jgi:ABC-type glycerol-3-phosphate transport system substrate-binding protein
MKTYTRRTFAVLAAGIVVAGALTGCGSGSGDGDGKVTLTFANADPAATWAKVIEGFEAKNPDITVKQLNVPYAQFTSTINQRLSQGGGGGIDLFAVDTGVAVDFYNRGFLADLSDMRADATAAAVSPDMVEQNVIDGKLVAIEAWTTSQFLYYNKDLLDKAGVEAPPSDPTQPWTWEQLAAAAEKVKAANAAQYAFLFDQWDTYYQLQPLGVSAGGGNGIDGDQVSFSNPGWQRALSWYHDLFEKGLSPRGITNDKNGALFQEGKAAFLVSGPWGLTQAVAGKLNFGIAPEPYFAGGKPATSTDSWSVGISAKTDNLEAAKKFLRYMTIDPTGNAESAEVAAITPTNRHAYERYAAKATAAGGDAAKNFGTIMEYQLQNNAIHRPSVVGYSVFEPGANKMFADIRNGTDPKKAAEQADSSIEDQLKRLK